MKKEYVSLTSRAAVWSPRFSGLAFLILLFSTLLQRYSMLRISDFIVLIILSACCIFLSLFLAIKALYSLWTYGTRGGMKALKGIIFSLITATPLILSTGWWFALPAIYDVSTDTQKPPVFFRTLRPSNSFPFKNDLSKQAKVQMSQWPEMSGRRYDGSPDHIRKSVFNVLAARGWPVLAQQNIKNEDNEFYIATIAKTICLNFVSDIVIRLTDEGNTTFVDMRATSRHLPRDFGTNAAFIIAFMDALDTEIASIPFSSNDELKL
ncbi:MULTISPECIES: DUF1499 domain-containing protein [Bartonella]|uniref:DUF1499 domain-containing protein n=1 Tax=Bartonella rochalimae ATCC BAA-1498 TaxID=685782 RepID=E6YKR5_9HYPH|nr:MULTISPECIES: DUF1499 domain-containing protein [Bartonella]AQX18702.1 Protein of unknown function (DUF1499) [Bartonella sp. A1379B]AQX23214.1 Protein of unknown function (DUF1499) [Bartonella sp. 11B]AQX23484.1 Protein of unknown function (DUF1499) [Bartonella sp. 114]AQX25672.1 Protein of unknown function (DUF1499) [Bartonella sp. Coyote22sub2]KEC54169.1 hypothetical protein O99_01050 [Bartonella rochalimae ATCC BAA-1498]